MKLAVVLICTLAIICRALSAPQLRADEDVEVDKKESDFVLTKALPCDPELCKAPACRCSSTVLDSSIPVEQTAQLVMLTFDDAVTAANYEYIEELMKGRRNPDGCSAAATFFVSHEYTDYSKVHALWSDGHEIALHSISHAPSVSYWKNATVDLLMQEFNEEREMISHFAQINREDIKGIRVPLFQLAGDNSFEMMRQAGLYYDCSMPSQHFTNPGMWPYSLDYASTQDCPLDDCPEASIPGVWVAPILSWSDLEGYQCSMVDACQYLPEDDEELMFQWMKTNFDRHYKGNRAPFGVFIHAAWFLIRESHWPAYKRLVEYMNSKPDVYLVSVSQAVDYTRNPRPVSNEQVDVGLPETEPELESETEVPAVDDQEQSIGGGGGAVPFMGATKRDTQIMDSCQKLRTPDCTPKLCQLRKESTNEERWMTSCAVCPEVYPWLGNPLGLRL